MAVLTAPQGLDAELLLCGSSAGVRLSLRGPDGTLAPVLVDLAPVPTPNRTTLFMRQHGTPGSAVRWGHLATGDALTVVCIGRAVVVPGLLFPRRRVRLYGPWEGMRKSSWSWGHDVTFGLQRCCRTQRLIRSPFSLSPLLPPTSLEGTVLLVKQLPARRGAFEAHLLALVEPYAGAPPPASPSISASPSAFASTPVSSATGASSTLSTSTPLAPAPIPPLQESAFSSPPPPLSTPSSASSLALQAAVAVAVSPPASALADAFLYGVAPAPVNAPPPGEPETVSAAEVVRLRPPLPGTYVTVRLPRGHAAVVGLAIGDDVLVRTRAQNDSG